MSHEANKDAVRIFFGAMKTGDIDDLQSVISDDYVSIVSGQSKMSGRFDRNQAVAFVEGIPELTRGGFDYEIMSLTAEDDRVVAESRGHSILRNGAEYNNQYLHLFRFRDGKICESTEYTDTALAESVFVPVFAQE